MGRSLDHQEKEAYRLRIVLDCAYHNVIAECADAMSSVMPRNVVNVQKRNHENCVEVGSSSRSWPFLFPQHGPGPKHERKIELTEWQLEIVEQHPEMLVRGLIQSDGCRCLNKSMGRVHIRYLFVNASEDIRRIFCNACDQLSIKWRHPKERTISIARRESTALLDTFVGPKT